MLYYVPLESYRERYTMQWSAPGIGWLERNWRKAGIAYTRIAGKQEENRKTIKTGAVLDCVGRSMFCFSQIAELLRAAEYGHITNDDVIYFDDFWSPGMEALPYAFSMLGIKPKVYAFLHAQSVDEFDFTYPMRGWMRHFERGIGEFLSGIFVCGPCLRDLVVWGGIAPADKVHITGHPFSSEEVLERMPDWWNEFIAGSGKPKERLNRVVYSSRWDREKNPNFFLRVAEEIIKRMPEAVFVVCSSALNIRSNDPKLVELLHDACRKYPDNILLRDNLTKEEYYAELCRAKIQMNTADQDFVAITLLEASVAGCYPVYPYFRSFPETFLYKPGYMYERLNLTSAVESVLSILRRDDLWDLGVVRSRQWIHSRFDFSWSRMLHHMGLVDCGGSDPYKLD